MVSRNIYDSFNHLRFALTADDRVTEHVYNARGERITTYKYAANTYPTAGTYTETALNTWARRSARQRARAHRYTYDFRSNVRRSRVTATTGTTGAGTAVGRRATATTSAVSCYQHGRNVRRGDHDADQ